MSSNELDTVEMPECPHWQCDGSCVVGVIASTKQEAIEEGKEIAYGNVAKWFIVPIKLQDDTNCGVCGGALAEVRSKYPHGEKRKVCPTCAIEILEDIYSSCANRTASQLNELQDRKVEE